MNNNRISRLNQLQDEAVDAVIDNGGRGTVCLATGLGKTFTFFKFLYKLLDRGSINLEDEVWFLAETNTRELTLKEEIQKFREIYQKSVDEDFKIKFMCYQAKPVGKPVVIGADEIHDSLTPEYGAAYDNEYKFIMGLSAVIPQHLKLYREDEFSQTKGGLLDEIAPIVFTKSLTEAIQEGLLSPFETTVLNHTLDDTNRYIEEGSKTKRWKTTEYKYYDFRDKQRRRFFLNQFYRQKCAREAARSLWTAKSKAEFVKKLLPHMEGKTIIFATEVDMLQMILPDEMIVAGTKGTKQKTTVQKRSGKTEEVIRRASKPERENTEIIEKFNRGEINVIGSCKKLKQGITLEGVQNAIVISYYKEGHHIIQQLGRLVRFVPDKMARLYIFRTLNTFEEKWFEELHKIKDEKGKVIGEIDLNITQQIYTKDTIRDDYI